MRLSENIRSMLEEQYRHEKANHFIYTQARAWAEYKGFNNVAAFFKAQADGENDHAELVFSYLMDKNDIINIEPFNFDNPSFPFAGGTLISLFEAGLKTEYGTTEALSAIYKAAFAENDFMTSEFMLPMIKEQAEEESVFQTILDRFAIYFDSPGRDHLLDIWVGETFNK
jgi:ferritin